MTSATLSSGSYTYMSGMQPDTRMIPPAVPERSRPVWIRIWVKPVLPDNKNAWPTAIRRVAALIGLTLACGGPLSLAADRAVPTYDLIIEHGRVIDGTGAPWFAADVGIRAGRVAAIGRLDEATAKRRINAAGSVVAPGFIDMLGQSELTLLVNPHVPSKIFQGITTEMPPISRAASR
jgi:hypothetical protein